MNRPSDVEKLSSDKRLAWRALSTLGTQLFLMDPALSVEEVPPTTGMSTATVTISYCNEEGCICMEYILNLAWTEDAPS